MKKIFALIIITLSLSGILFAQTTQKANTKERNTKVLILYYSYTGNPIKEKDIDECKELPITGIAYVNIKKYA